MALSERRVKDNIVQAAEPSGMPGLRLDGNDVLAVFDSAVQAVTRAGPVKGHSLGMSDVPLARSRRSGVGHCSRGTPSS